MTDEQDQRTINLKEFRLIRRSVLSDGSGFWNVDWAENHPEAAIRLHGDPLTQALADRVIHLEDALISKDDALTLEVLKNINIPDRWRDRSSHPEGDHDTGEEGSEQQNPESGDIRQDSALHAGGQSYLRMGLERSQEIMFDKVTDLPALYGLVKWHRCDDEPSKVHITGPDSFGGATICGHMIGDDPHAFDGPPRGVHRLRVCHLCLRVLRRRVREAVAEQDQA